MEESTAYQGSDSLDYDLRFLGNYPTAVVAFHGRLSWQTKEEKKDGGTFPSCCINFTRLGNIVSFWARIGHIGGQGVPITRHGQSHFFMANAISCHFHR